MSSITSITINLRLDRLLISSITSIFDHKSSIDLTLIVFDYFDYYRLFAYFLCKCLSLLRRGSRQAGGLILFFLFTIFSFRPILCASRRRVQCNQVKTDNDKELTHAQYKFTQSLIGLRHIVVIRKLFKSTKLCKFLFP